VTNFTYVTSDEGAKHVDCVKEPGQSVCAVQNAYDNCDGVGSGNYYDPEATGSRDRVISQTFATGESISYSYINYPSQFEPCRGHLKTTMTQAGAATEVVMGATLPTSVKDQLSRISLMNWIGPAIDYPEFTRLQSYTSPDGNIVQHTYDTRGNRTEARRKAKPGTGLADIVTSATYLPLASCSSVFTCNKPLTTTDANGNITTYTYDAAHGGVLTQSGPAVGGVSPRKKYSYAQRYAWIKNAGGGYSQAASPVWVLTEERTCRTSTLNLSTGACSAGTSDRVTTVCDYGPDSGPNNLWLRGVAVTANSQTLRTCYGYDEYGRRISETAPNANPPSCS
jgi:YD repeat-containing protein